MLVANRPIVIPTTAERHPPAIPLLLKQTVSEWLDDKAPQLGAALAFYSVLSLAPLVVILVTIAGSVFGEEFASTVLLTNIRGLIGPAGSDAVQQILINAKRPQAGAWTSVLSGLTLLFGASGVFGQLQTSLNAIWKVKPQQSGIAGIIRDRCISVAMVLGASALMVVLLTLSTAIGDLGAGLRDQSTAAAFRAATNLLVSLSVMTVVFALVFKAVPATQVPWKDTWIGAILTASLFLVGNSLLSLYLGSMAVGSPYGTAGSLVVLVVWVYYSAQILFLGAEFTQAYSRLNQASNTPGTREKQDAPRRRR